MKRQLLLAALLCPLAWAQPVTTHIHDTLYDQSGNVYTGSVQVALSTPSVTSSSAPILRVVETVRIVAGILDLYLVPNDTASPSLTAYLLTFGSGDKKTCTIPSSSSPIALAAYCTDNAPLNPTPVIPLSWLNTAGAISGDGICLVGLNWTPCAGATGPTGPQGAAGPTGLTGSAGTTGSNGAVGPTGAAGSNGAAGATGSNGAAGPTGLTGSAGTNGSNGAAGATGSQGVAGPTGLTGSAGTNGSNGAAGATGSNGAAGPTGLTGSAGTNGSNGAAGATGSQGVAGPTGAPGATGTQGIQGATGSNGSTGATGPAPSGTGVVTVNSGVAGAVTVSGDGTLTASTGALAVTGINGVALGSTTATAGNLLIAGGTNWVTKTLSGDCTLTSAGAITCASTGGVAFAGIATGGRWDQLQTQTGALTLATAANATTFNATAANVWTWANTTAAISGTTQPSPIHKFCGNTYNSGSVQSCTTFQLVPSGFQGNFAIIGGTAANNITVSGFGSFIVSNAPVIVSTTASASTAGFDIGNLALQVASNTSNVWQHTDANSGHAYADVAVSHVIGSSAAPTAAAGAGAGTSPTINVPTGNDSAMGISLTVGTPSATAGIIETITFNLGFTNIAGTAKAPYCSLTPANAATALLSGVTGAYITTTATTLVINSGSTAPTAGTALAWHALCTGTNQ